MRSHTSSTTVYIYTRHQPIYCAQPSREMQFSLHFTFKRATGVICQFQAPSRNIAPNNEERCHRFPHRFLAVVASALCSLPPTQVDDDGGTLQYNLVDPVQLSFFLFYFFICAVPELPDTGRRHAIHCAGLRH